MKLLLQQKEHSLTAAEKRVVGVLLANYPSAALTSISQLANQASVSDPTVHRFIVKLGFEGYLEFQKAVLIEVDERMNSPLSLLESAAYDPNIADIERTMLGSLALAVGKTAEHATPDDFERAVALIADTRHGVWCCGGRASGFLAQRLVAHLSQLRARARQIEPSLERAHEGLVDIEAGDVLVVYDYRRYQDSVGQFARIAQQRGARIVLFTDEWRSPIANFAEAVLVSFVQAFASPFDTKVPALAQSESLIAALVQRLPDQAKARLKQIEALREGSAGSDTKQAPSPR
ncbi:MurR/RpiR family transcriptional regulator [Burkholderia sp. JSH-S8]|uniref:MurR/RpiR family transcriptional regulator n=1 Tax=Burkholderia stagnalis TaxID=1503054 RepID=UPI0013DEF1C6|nr:MurR/RpiR family transcriptional regulator [Burkholderia stagnalis]WGS44943.1 MurR/RpiR family transcriptional regulator [Burkholderia sp. JSH-S8]